MEGIQNQDKTGTEANKQKPPPYEKKRTPDMRVSPGAQEESETFSAKDLQKLQFHHGPDMHVSGTKPSSVILSLNYVIWPKSMKIIMSKNVPKDVAEWVGYDATGTTF
ncbi:hypothetical protein FSP39_013272 [Pinctada imbricata]|uniref:Uncharacterized protein n=1 Tax=Pinctada imbricata TaxID=66713 RepID=A0AA88YG89_PINIB|nr:hypothetical protein FSP39_013272 [Pinctada imbricata]